MITKPLLTTDLKGVIVSFDYINWKGKAGKKRVKVLDLAYALLVYKDVYAFVLNGVDLDKGQRRTYEIPLIENFKIEEGSHGN